MKDRMRSRVSLEREKGTFCFFGMMDGLSGYREAST